MTTAQLNAAAALIGTDNKEVVLAICIKTLVDAGMDIKVAFDAVMGSGQFDALASKVYAELNK